MGLYAAANRKHSVLPVKFVLQGKNTVLRRAKKTKHSAETPRNALVSWDMFVALPGALVNRSSVPLGNLALLQVTCVRQPRVHKV